MTPENKANLLRVLQPLIAVLLGTLLSAIAFLLAGFASSACHCARPIAVAFPFATIVVSMSRWDSVAGVLMAFQFPIYGLLVALGKTRRKRAQHALILLTVHVVAVIGALLIYRGS